MELILDFSTDMSIRNATRRINRIRRENEGLKPTTYRNIVEREGQKIQKYIEEKTTNALTLNGFDINSELPENNDFKPNKAYHISEKKVAKKAEKTGVAKYNISDYERGGSVVNISLDDVCVKRQTEIRPRDEDSQQPKRVYNSVAHIECGKGKYILNSGSLAGVIKIIIGFLLLNGLAKKQLIFFTDGARDIHEQLSMALKGNKIRNDFLDELLPCLWFGNVDGAISLLQNIDSNKVRNQSLIVKLIEYLERVRNYIPCYILRKNLGLRNSSNSGEKSNDLIVASRQKHNGMSWSNDGSIAFATISSSAHNNQLLNWVHTNEFVIEPIKIAA